MEQIPTHAWEYTVQAPNGDWHYTRSSGRISFREAVIEALTYESSIVNGRLVSVVNIDLPDGPSEAQELFRAGYPIGVEHYRRKGGPNG